MNYEIILMKKAKKDLLLLEQKPAWYKKVEELLSVMVVNPFQNPPPFERLGGDMEGIFSRRINIQHRLVYTVIEKYKEIVIHSFWSHYE